MSKSVVKLGVVGFAVCAAVSMSVPEPIAARGAAARAQAVQPAASTVPAKAVMDKYCVTCHNERLKRGDLVLEKLDPADVGADVATWEKVVRKLHAGVMPPIGMPRPDPATYKAFIGSIETALDKHAAASPNPGRPTIHRLNRAEYTNAIRDLLSLDIDGKALLPADNSGYGFDNVADVLTVSPGLLERYLLAAKKIARLAVGDPTTRPATTVYDIPYMTLVQDERMSEAVSVRGSATTNEEL